MTKPSSAAGVDSRVRDLVTIALLAAVLCILAPLSIPIGPVPISLTNLCLYFFVFIVGMKRTSIAFVVYCLLGMVGLPVFSGYTGGVAKLVGPTGGYIVGFLPMIIVMGLFIDRHKTSAADMVLDVIVMEAATWIPYLLGTAWLAYAAHMTFGKAMAAGVIPFVLEDLAKMILAAVLAPQICRRLKKARLTD